MNTFDHCGFGGRIHKCKSMLIPPPECVKNKNKKTLLTAKIAKTVNVHLRKCRLTDQFDRNRKKKKKKQAANNRKLNI